MYSNYGNNNNNNNCAKECYKEPNQDKILLENMPFFGYHGVLECEAILGQRFYVSVEIGLDTEKAGKSDNVVDSINYAEVYDVIKRIVEKERFNLLEALAQNIADQIFKKFCLADEVTVTIKKPSAPVNAIIDYFGVQITRKRPCKNVCR